MPIKDNFYVVDFQFIDDYRCLRPLIESVQNPHSELPIGPEERQRERELRAELELHFTAAGWEGDGEINCIFMPPCFVGGDDDGWCEIVYHVKQSNNGTSWLAIPNRLEVSLPKGMLHPKEA